MQKDPQSIQDIKERYQIEFKDNAYQDRITEVLENKYGKGSLASSLCLEEILIDWDNFINDLKATAYEMSYSDFSMDVKGFRGLLQLIEEKMELKSFEEHKQCIEVLTRIDAQFAEISFANPNFENPQPWWMYRILKKASYLYFTSMGIDVSQFDVEVVK